MRPSSSAVLVLLLLLSNVASAQAAALQVLRSPDRRIEVRIDLGDRIRYSVLADSQALVQDATLGLQIDQATLGVLPKLTAAKASSVDQEIEPVVRQKAAKLRERYNQLRLDLRGGYAVVFRAYDEGVAYRFETALPRAEVKIHGEEVGLNFAGDYAVYYPKEESFFSHNEREFVHLPLNQVAPGDLASLPAVVEARDGIKVAIASTAPTGELRSR